MVGIVAVDIGNSSIKLALAGQSEQGICRLEDGFAANEIAEFVSASGSKNLRWFVCSVNRQAYQKLVTAVESLYPDSTIVELTHEHVPLKINIDEPSKAGIDRLVAAWAARGSFEDDTLIVVDAGTAVTVDVVQKDQFSGGLIFPGPTTSLAALGSQAEALPDLANSWNEFADHDMQNIDIGKDSEPAILLGVHQHFFCGLQSLVNRLALQHPGSKVICTGGILNRCRGLVDSEWIFVESLVLDGVSSIARLQTSDK